MKGDFGKLIGRFGSTAATFVAVILWLFPCSLSILCIAPGGHIEIEDISTSCCPPSDIAIPFGDQPDNGSNAPGDCQDCSDFFIVANGSEAVLKSHDHATPGPFSNECLEHRLSADIPLLPCRAGATRNIDIPIPVSPPVPLLC